jgi:hypothetical protein
MYVKTLTATAIIALLVAFPLFFIRHKPSLRRLFNGNCCYLLNGHLYDIDDLMV